jgi:hypothetical protein
MRRARDVCIFYFDSPTVGLRAAAAARGCEDGGASRASWVSNNASCSYARRAAASIKRAATAIMSLFNSSYLIPILSLSWAEDAAAAQESYAVAAAAFLLLK